MTKSLRNTPLPPIPQGGTVTWEGIRTLLTAWQTQALAHGDIRNDASDIAGALYQDAAGKVVVGADARLTGRTSSSLPTVLSKVTDAGRAQDQRFLYPVTAANRSSVQSANTILTASSGSSTCTISVAAHEVTYDFGVVSYSAGSISGLTVSTQYLVYCLDPDYAGGAVTYLATQNPENVISAGAYYVGVIDTPAAQNSFSVTAATTANPIVITTASAHGWATNDTVTFSGMTGGFTALNGNSYTITVTGGSTFSVPVNGSLYAAYSGSGSVQRIVTSTQGGAGAAAGGGGDQAWLDFTLSF